MNQTLYGEDNSRTNKYDDNRNKETLYFNQYWVEHVNGTNRAYSGDSIKHIFLNNERLVSKVCTNNLHGSTQTYLDYEQMHTYYWHSDHLGSATLITDYQGKEYERIEYTPYGELWIDQNQAYVDGYLPYRFTGKELDEETGLYYYGQRYLDPQYSIWMTSDPAIYDYMSQSKNGEGGIYNITNLNLYHYAGNNPIKYTDPDGKIKKDANESKFVFEVLGQTGLDIYNNTNFYASPGGYNNSFSLAQDLDTSQISALGYGQYGVDSLEQGIYIEGKQYDSPMKTSRGREILIHEIYHQIQYQQDSGAFSALMIENNVNREFSNSTYYYDLYSLGNKKITDLEYYEAQAQFVGDFGKMYYEQRYLKNSGPDSNLKNMANIMANSGFADTEAVKWALQNGEL